MTSPGTQTSARASSVQVDGEAEHDEGDDLAEAGQRGVEALDLALVGGPLVAEQDAGHEHGQEARAVGQRRGAEQDERAGQRAQRVEALAGQRHRRG